MRPVLLLTGVMVLFTLYILAAPPYHPWFEDFRMGSGPHEDTTVKLSCPPDAYGDGQWVRRPHPGPPMHKSYDVYAVSDFAGCASSCEPGFHLSHDRPDFFDWRAQVSNYDWVPASGCSMPSWDREAMVRSLVERGGWFLVGDSITEGHFFSLSCMLSPHVVATPLYIEGEFWDRAAPQDLYLSPSSPLIPTLHFPHGFDIEKTPLITYRRIDLLLSHEELKSLYSMHFPHLAAEGELFSGELSWTKGPSEYFKYFMQPLPLGNYHLMLLNTAGHWTTSLYPGLTGGLPQVLQFFEESMAAWIRGAAEMLDYEASEAIKSSDEMGVLPKSGPRKDRQLIVRGYMHGHEGCLYPEWRNGGPIPNRLPLNQTWYNWDWIDRFNGVFDDLIRARQHPRIHFLDVGNPYYLRPDAHALGDCLHLTIGTGVVEGWTEYIWYFLNQISS